MTVDTAGPGQPTLDLATASDSGSSDSDNLTSVTTPVLNGAAEAGSTVAIYDNGVFAQAVTAGTDGTWTATLAALADGAHPLTVTATDTSGNTSPVSDTLTVTVDTDGAHQADHRPGHRQRHRQLHHRQRHLGQHPDAERGGRGRQRRHRLRRHHPAADRHRRHRRHLDGHPGHPRRRPAPADRHRHRHLGQHLTGL